jgi:hypothetical protein
MREFSSRSFVRDLERQSLTRARVPMIKIMSKAPHARLETTGEPYSRTVPSVTTQHVSRRRERTTLTLPEGRDVKWNDASTQRNSMGIGTKPSVRMRTYIARRRPGSSRAGERDVRWNDASTSVKLNWSRSLSASIMTVREVSAISRLFGHLLA